MHPHGGCRVRLTGAIVVALVHPLLGRSHDDSLRAKVMQRRRRKAKRMCDAVHSTKELHTRTITLKRAFADLPTSRDVGGAISTAATFLKEFADSTALGPSR